VVTFVNDDQADLAALGRARVCTEQTMTSAAIWSAAAFTLPTNRSGSVCFSLSSVWSASSSRCTRMTTRVPSAAMCSAAMREKTTVLPMPVASTTAGRCMPSAHAAWTASMASRWYGLS
jgi:hypothetical protein